MTTEHRIRLAALVLLTSMSVRGSAAADEADADGSPDYLAIVRAYADALLEHGRDVYGEEHSPLIATTLDGNTMRLFEGDALLEIASIPRAGWDIRPGDRMVTGANPMHHENFYQTLYALSTVTGDKHYAEEADTSLRWFFDHCQSETTGLMAWGEHIGWDFIEEKAKGGPHEFFRPWVLWERCYELAPANCATFARSVWDHQIGDPETGNFSRHAKYERHGPDTGKEFPRHGGFYIATWAAGYERTKDPVFLKAIETLLNYFDGRRNPHSGAIPCQSAAPFGNKTVWPPSNLSLAVDLWDSVSMVPDDLAAKMRRSASRTDEVYLSIEHDLSREGNGFVAACQSDNLHVLEYGKGVWGAGYGSGGDANTANLCVLRFRQVGLDGYRNLILQAGERYAGSEPGPDGILHPGTLGDAIFLMLACHELTEDPRYIAEANRFAGLAIEAFLKDGHPLPPATTRHRHYEAITRGDTLMMALLQLWLAQNQPQSRVTLVYTDR